jgi:hypothetical protein
MGLNLRCCISKIYYMSLVKYIARLQRMDSLIAMRATGPPDEFACRMHLSRGTISATLQAEREIPFVVKQNWKITDDHISLWSDPYQSISGYSNRCWLGTYNGKCHYCIIMHLIRLKVLPTFRAADFWFGQLSSEVTKAIIYESLNQ